MEGGNGENSTEFQLREVAFPVPEGKKTGDKTKIVDPYNGKFFWSPDQTSCMCHSQSAVSCRLHTYRGPLMRLLLIPRRIGDADPIVATIPIRPDPKQFMVQIGSVVDTKLGDQTSKTSIANEFRVKVPTPNSFTDGEMISEEWVCKTMKNEWENSWERKHKEDSNMELKERKARLKAEGKKKSEIDKEQPIPALPIPPLEGAAIVKERHARCIEVEEKAIGLQKDEHRSPGGIDAFQQMVLQKDETSIMALKTIQHNNGPGKGESACGPGEGYIVLSKMADGQHRMHFWMLRKQAEFSAKEGFDIGIHSSADGDDNTPKDTSLTTTTKHAINSYTSKRLQDSSYSVLHPVEEYLFHIHAEMASSSEYHSKHEALKKVSAHARR